jgi:hypothetical protein
MTDKTILSPATLMQAADAAGRGRWRSRTGRRY